VAAVIFDTPQTLKTEEEVSDGQRVDRAMDAAVKIASVLTIPVFVCNHANRAATAARNKRDRNLARSAGLHSVSIEHRAQIGLFMEKVGRKDGVTEVDVEVTKAPISHLEFRLLLDIGYWTLREIDIADETEEKAEHVKKVRTEHRNTVLGELRTGIMAVILPEPTHPSRTGASFASIWREVGGRDGTLRNELAVMCEPGGLLERLPGPEPSDGGKTPQHWRLLDPAHPYVAPEATPKAKAKPVKAKAA